MTTPATTPTSDPQPLAPVPRSPRRLVYLGTPEMAVRPLQALVDAGFEVPLVVSATDKRRGRGGALVPSPVKAAAINLHLTVSDRVEDATDCGADLGVVVAFGRLIRRPVLERLPMVNIHFSLLPRWRGAAPVERSLLAGDAETGTCLMQLEVGLDTGPVFDRVVVPIGPRETAAELRERLVAAGSEQLVRCLTAGLGEPAAQTGEASYAAKFDAAEFCLDWSQPAEALDRWVRVGGVWTTFRDRRLKVLAAQPVPGDARTDAHTEPGALDGVVVACGHGALRLVTVQPEGKGPMAAEAWANGARPAPGERLGR